MSGQIIDATQFSSDQYLETDILVIGSGASGGTVAEIFARNGNQVLILEEGPYHQSNEFKNSEFFAYKNLYQEFLTRHTEKGEIALLQGRGVGGGTTINWASSFRTPPQVLDYWKNVLGIPISFDNLKPWFEYSEERYNVIPWQLDNMNNQMLKSGLENLNWHWGRISRNVLQCENLGQCGLGCPNDAKQSTLITSIPSAINLGATLIYNAKAWSFKSHRSQMAELEVRAKSSQTQKYTGVNLNIRARYFILCGSALGSPGLLLRSKVKDPHKTLGKRTMLHPVSFSIAKFPWEINGNKGAPQSIYCDQHLWNNHPNPSIGYKIETSPVYPAFMSAILGDYGLTHFQKMQEIPYLQSLITFIRDGFHPKSEGGEIVLKNEEPLLSYPISYDLWEVIRKSFISMGEIQFAAGAEKVYPVHLDYRQGFANLSELKDKINTAQMREYIVKLGSAHAMGGCSMGVNPKTSVVDPSGRVHQYNNLYVMDASIFPTSLGVNPQLTIFAMSSYLANQLIANIPIPLNND